MRRLSRVLALAGVLALISGAAYGFGYTHGDTYQAVKPSGTAQFNVYLFGEETVTGGVVNLPGGWTADVDPGTVDLSRPGDYDYRYMSLGGEVQKVVDVKVTVDPSRDAEEGLYTVGAVFRSGGGSGLSVSQVQEFDFTVEVEGEQQVSGGTSSGTGAAGTSATATTSGGTDVPGTELPAGDGETGEEERGGEEDTRGVDGGVDAPEAGEGEEGARDFLEGSPVGDASEGISSALSGLTGRVSVSPAVAGLVVFEILWILALLYLMRRDW